MSDFADAALNAEADRQRRTDEQNAQVERQRQEQAARDLRAVWAVGTDFVAAANRRGIAPNGVLRWNQTVERVEHRQVGLFRTQQVQMRQRATIAEESVWAVLVRDPKVVASGEGDDLTWIVRPCGEIFSFVYWNTNGWDGGCARAVQQVSTVTGRMRQDLLQSLASVGDGGQLPGAFVNSIDLDSQPDLRR
jgi:hypothetical protein